MTIEGVTFKTAWTNVVEQGHVVGRGPIFPALESLTRQLYDALDSDPISAATVKAAIIAVLRLLTTPEGRTDANCYAVDLFMVQEWMTDVDRELVVGDELNDVLIDMGGALHDTIGYPHIAENFYSTPEQLLQRAEDAKVPTDAP